MGAVPGSRLLSGRGLFEGPGPFDVDSFRTAGRRVVLREVARPLLVLGSTQPDSVLDLGRVRGCGVGVARRRSGGGAVLLAPGAQVWADLWVPRGDPLWTNEPRASAVVAGEWWVRALAAQGLDVHRGPSVPAPGSDVVCFAGVGPGEVTRGRRKVVGLAQWRSREGVLVHGCAYRRWDPEPLVDLLALAAGVRKVLRAALAEAVAGVEDLDLPDWRGPDALVGALPDVSSWEVLEA